MTTRLRCALCWLWALEVPTPKHNAEASSAAAIKPERLAAMFSPGYDRCDAGRPFRRPVPTLNNYRRFRAFAGIARRFWRAEAAPAKMASDPTRAHAAGGNRADRHRVRLLHQHRRHRQVLEPALSGTASGLGALGRAGAADVWAAGAD